jgi:hypothetical protein
MLIDNSFRALAIMVPPAEEAVSALPRSHESAVQLSLLIGFFTLMIVTGILFSGTREGSAGKRAA